MKRAMVHTIGVQPKVLAYMEQNYNTWVFYQFNDDLTFVDPSLFQRMRFIVYHNVQKDIDPNSTHHGKGLVMYTKTMAQLPWIFMLHQNIL